MAVAEVAVISVPRDRDAAIKVCLHRLHTHKVKIVVATLAITV